MRTLSTLNVLEPAAFDNTALHTILALVIDSFFPCVYGRAASTVYSLKIPHFKLSFRLAVFFQ